MVSWNRLSPECAVHTYAEIAEVFGISQKRVRQIEEAAMEKIWRLIEEDAELGQALFEDAVLQLREDE